MGVLLLSVIVGWGWGCVKSRGGDIVLLCFYGRYRKRRGEREREREREREGGREGGRKTDRQTDRQIDR